MKETAEMYLGKKIKDAAINELTYYNISQKLTTNDAG